MNERIKELAEQAGYMPDVFGIGHWNMPECKRFYELVRQDERQKLAQPEQPMSPEHLPQYIATNNLKPTIKGGGGAGGAQLEQEPVAWLVSDAQGRYATIRDPAPYGEEVYEPLYAAPQSKPWVGLTDEEVASFENAGIWGEKDIRAIEAKLKEKNSAP